MKAVRLVGEDILGLTDGSMKELLSRVTCMIFLMRSYCYPDDGAGKKGKSCSASVQHRTLDSAQGPGITDKSR